MLLNREIDTFSEVMLSRLENPLSHGSVFATAFSLCPNMCSTCSYLHYTRVAEVIFGNFTECRQNSMGNAGQMIESMPGKEGWEACNELPNLQRTSEPVAEILEQTTPLSFLARTQIKLVSGIGFMETSAPSMKIYHAHVRRV